MVPKTAALNLPVLNTRSGSLAIVVVQHLLRLHFGGRHYLLCVDWDSTASLRDVGSNHKGVDIKRLLVGNRGLVSPAAPKMIV